jgi:DUF971 family protein
VLELGFENAPSIRLRAEFLRVNSPSAEVQGHGPGERVLVTGKADVRIVAIHPVGNYAILLEFSDEHRTGIYSFGYLAQLAREYDTLWARYEADVAASMAHR